MLEKNACALAAGADTHSMAAQTAARSARDPDFDMRVYLHQRWQREQWKLDRPDCTLRRIVPVQPGAGQAPPSWP